MYTFLRQENKNMPLNRKIQGARFSEGVIKNKNKDLVIRLATWKFTEFKRNGLESCTKLSPF